MGWKLGYDNTESDQTFYVRHSNPSYKKFINLMTGQNLNKKLEIEFNATKSSYSMKYAIDMKNIFFYQMPYYQRLSILDTLTFDFQVAQKKKAIKLIDFDILPILKFAINNESERFPFSIYFKYGHYESSRSQPYDNRATYDFSKIVKSMLPCKRFGVTISHVNSRDLFFLNRNFTFIYKINTSVNKMHGYEDNLKLSATLKTIFDIHEFSKLLTLGINNQFSIKRSFIKSNISNTNRNSQNREYNESHVLSLYECHSKLIGANLLNTPYVIENGSNFYIQNILMIRAKNFPFLKDSDFFSRIEPHFGLETIFVPEIHKNRLQIDKSFKFIYTLGVSIKLTDYMYVDFNIYTNAINTKLSKDMINRFRINLDISTGIK